MIDSTPRRVFLVDDHPILRKGLKGLIERKGNLKVVGEADSGREALEKIGNARPDLAIVDIAMDDMDGIELTGYISQKYPEVKILILSMHDDSRYIEKALEAGASGYVLKDNVGKTIERATRKVLAGERFLSSKAEEKLRSHR